MENAAIETNTLVSYNCSTYKHLQKKKKKKKKHKTKQKTISKER